MSFTSPPFLIAAVGLLIVTAIVVRVRRPALPRLTLVLAGIGAVMWCAAAGGAQWRRPRPHSVLVQVDCSPSTRGADFRSRARLTARIAQLLNGVPYRIEYFADGPATEPPAGTTLADVPAEQTVLPAPRQGDAVLLFSDGQFPAPPPVGVPVYAVIDLALEETADASVHRLDLRGETASVEVRNTGPPRVLSLSGVEGTTPTTAPAGAYTLSRHVAKGATRIAAQLAPGDRWPENDVLAAVPAPPQRSEAWWVGPHAAASWQAYTAGTLPTEPSAWLAPSVVVLENVPNAELDDARRSRLLQYVRDLGGALVIFGGDHAFAAGGYPGSTLETLSPLASTPPEPTTHWMLLADGSGSMAEAAVPGGATKWRLATDALVKLLPTLPPDDVASVGSFAESLDWWSTGKSVRRTVGLSLPPPNVGPHGPTNLEHVLSDIAESADAGLPRQLLVLTDANVQIDDPAKLAARIRSKNIHLHVLAIEEGTGLAALKTIVDATRGSLQRQLDPQRWAASVSELMRPTAPNLLQQNPMPVEFLGRLAGAAAVQVAPWNRTWLKQSAELLARHADDPAHPPAIATWRVGNGEVAAAAFDAGPDEIGALVKLIARPPHDPRYRVSWETGPHVRVTVEAFDGRTYLNEQHITLALESEGSGSAAPSDVRPVPQTGPGRYELSLPAPRTASLAVVRAGDRIIDRIAIAGRYAPEFDAIGNDRSALRELARRTGGQLIEPGQTTPLQFTWPTRTLSAVPLLATLGAVFVALGLGYWRMM